MKFLKRMQIPFFAVIVLVILKPSAHATIISFNNATPELKLFVATYDEDYMITAIKNMVKDNPELVKEVEKLSSKIKRCAVQKRFNDEIAFTTMSLHLESMSANNGKYDASNQKAKERWESVYKYIFPIYTECLLSITNQ